MNIMQSPNIGVGKNLNEKKWIIAPRIFPCKNKRGRIRIGLFLNKKYSFSACKKIWVFQKTDNENFPYRAIVYLQICESSPSLIIEEIMEEIMEGTYDTITSFIESRYGILIKLID